jgi:hypothetical protein
MDASGISVIPAGFRSRRIRYWTLFAVESAGLLYIIVEALPLYRALLRGPVGDRPGFHLLVPMASATAVMQACYWTKRKIRMRLRHDDNPFLGHVLLFVSRLSFIFAVAAFSLMMFTRSMDTATSPVGIAVLVAATFAQFCYARELEVLGRRMDRDAGDVA